MSERLPLGAPPTPAEEPQSVAEPSVLTSDSSLRAAMVGFEAHMRQRGFSENTAKAFMSDLGILAEFAGAGTALRDLSTVRLNQFVAWLRSDRGVSCSLKSLARRVTTLKVFFGWLVESGVLSTDPADPVIHRPVVSPMPTILSEAEVGRLLEVTETLRGGTSPDVRPHLLVTLLLHTGIKKGECMAIVLNHFDFSDPSHPLLWIRYANPRRRHKERKLTLPVWWPALLAEYRAQYEIQERVFPWTARNLEYVLTDLARQAELDGGLSFEMLRWTSAVRDRREGMGSELLRQKLGVSRITWRELSVKIDKLAGVAE
ncbi:MAG: site-specific integrase [Anaerolineales bacterium]|nr:site-specific integrase [Anaerolineales bacterium]